MAALPACSEGVHLAINSLAMYAAPRVKLLGELRAAGVPMHQVHVFLGDSPASDDGVYDSRDYTLRKIYPSHAFAAAALPRALPSITFSSAPSTLTPVLRSSESSTS